MDILAEILPLDGGIISISSILIVIAGIKITSVLKRCIKIQKIKNRTDNIMYEIMDRI